MPAFIPFDNNEPYEIVDGGRFGGGSYGYVYKAIRRGLDDPVVVAVKVMRERGPEAEELLRREYDCLVKLGEGESPDEARPLVPRAYGLGRVVSEDGLDEGLGLAMEYFEHESWLSLRELLDSLASGARSIEVVPGIWVARLGESLAKTIEACHKRGIVHRDLSDTNVLVRCHGISAPEVAVIDFGSAEQAERWERTVSGELQTRGLRGTALFESPEMREGVSGTMLEYRKKPTTDLFGIGALLVYARLSMEHTCRVATAAMEQSGGFAYQLVPLLSKLASPVGFQRYPITVADMELGTIARTLTNYNPTNRYFGGMSVGQRVAALLAGRVENAASLSMGEAPCVGTTLDEDSISELVRLATPMTFHGIAMRVADMTSGESVKTILEPKDGHAWIHEDGTLVIVPEGMRLRDEQMREEYSHGRIVKEWQHIDMSGKDVGRPWSEESIVTRVNRVVAPVMVDDAGIVTRLAPLTMHGWFEGMENARQFDLAGIDTSKVSDMADLFRGCSSLAELRLPNTFDYGSVRTMERMFSGCKELRKMSFLVRSDDKFEPLCTAHVNNFRKLFEGCTKLGSLDDGGLVCLLDTSGAQYLDSMFYGCSSIRGLDLSGFSTDNVTGFSSMFEFCTSLEWVRQGFSMRNARWTESMFRGCTSIEEVVFPVGQKSDGLYAQPQRAHPSSMFAGCSNMKKVELGGLLDHPLTSTWHLFADCSNLGGVSVVGMDTDGAQDMGGMFSGCESLVQVEGISELPTGSATTFGMMFSGCRSLKRLDLSRWDTRSLRTFSHMFRDCASLSELDISGWDTSSVTALSYAFDGANPDMEINLGDGLEFPQIRDESQYVRFAPPAFARRFAEG